jgi:hypothetical protein
MGTKPEAIKYGSFYQVHGNHQASAYIMRVQLGTKLAPDVTIDLIYPTLQRKNFFFEKWSSDGVGLILTGGLLGFLTSAWLYVQAG